jgi:hypothetical protein
MVSLWRRARRSACFTFSETPSPRPPTSTEACTRAPTMACKTTTRPATPASSARWAKRKKKEKKLEESHHQQGQSKQTITHNTTFIIIIIIISPGFWGLLQHHRNRFDFEKKNCICGVNCFFFFFFFFLQAGCVWLTRADRAQCRSITAS